MARYFFELSEGLQITSDDLGLDWNDDHTAVVCALRVLAKSIGESAIIRPRHHAKISVKREDGAVIGCVDITTRIRLLSFAAVDELARQEPLDRFHDPASRAALERISAEGR